MHLSYEFSNIGGSSNTFMITNPTEILKSDINELLIHECMVTQVSDLYTNQINIINYIQNLLKNVENEVMLKILKNYIVDVEHYVIDLKRVISDHLEEDPEENSFEAEVKAKNWKKDLSYARSLQTMTGYILNFYTPVKNLSSKLGYISLANTVDHLYNCTKECHNLITEISLGFVKNKIH